MCIFCEIIDGNIPSVKIIEGMYSLAIFDINPINSGHCLVISKAHISEIKEIPDEVLLDMMSLVKKLYPVINEVFDADGITTFENYGLHQEVDHVHFHLLPVYKNKPGINFMRVGSFEDSIARLDEIKNKLGVMYE